VGGGFIKTPTIINTFSYLTSAPHTPEGEIRDAEGGVLRSGRKNQLTSVCHDTNSQNRGVATKSFFSGGIRYQSKRSS
jgi:hypothetical protein